MADWVTPRLPRSRRHHRSLPAPRTRSGSLMTVRWQRFPGRFRATGPGPGCPESRFRRRDRDPRRTGGPSAGADTAGPGRPGPEPGRCRSPIVGG
ncbi:MAG: hypothetical protein AVDCRST_MAG41-221 [uncultured Corynebacteriales bacterium]|uniref:Uncharacterized protein n=1 Tax=uncultured Mycobacteriales bacterium TaxID=581187 RepID=A0A6J4HA17_9ACTN|nr:MAG: hypothetical protein AVDCRST_MAG41-221 [uncultured Corynebacteriales bacterium]